MCGLDLVLLMPCTQVGLLRSGWVAGDGQLGGGVSNSIQGGLDITLLRLWKKLDSPGGIRQNHRDRTIRCSTVNVILSDNVR